MLTDLEVFLIFLTQKCRFTAHFTKSFYLLSFWGSRAGTPRVLIMYFHKLLKINNVL